MVLRRALALAILTAGACRTSDPQDPPARQAETPARAGPAGSGDDHAAALAELRAFEDERRAATDFTRVPARGALGADPYKVAFTSNGAVGILRGADAIVKLDRSGHEIARAPAPPSPTALDTDATGMAWVGGTGSSRVVAFDADLREVVNEKLDGWTTRALLVREDWLFAADQRTGAITAVRIDRRGKVPRLGARRTVGSCREPIQLEITGRNLVVVCLVDHSIELYPLGPDRAPAAGAAPVRIVHDGPIWSVSALSDGDRDAIVAGGVEDHPLERADGGFRYIDSFLSVYQLEPGGARAERIQEINLSAEGVVTPKWVSLWRFDPTGASVDVIGYGSPVLATLRWDVLGSGSTPIIETRAFHPGITDMVVDRRSSTPEVYALAASPLLDSWLVVDQPDQPHHRVPVPAQGERSFESRLGEALFFTTAMSPWNRSDDELSRFTCETCHFEAYGDGRVHFTGRGTVHAATKPLRGLFNNRPHFTRALDESMTKMVNAEFRVANRWNGHDPGFALRAQDVPWVPRDGAP